MATLLGVALWPVIASRRVAAHDGKIHGTIHDVEICGFAFVPAELTVSIGDGIRWTNRDLAPHSATAIDGTWDTGTIEEGQSLTLEVVRGMAPAYQCVFHPTMTARLTIRPV